MLKRFIRQPTWLPIIAIIGLATLVSLSLGVWIGERETEESPFIFHARKALADEINYDSITNYDGCETETAKWIDLETAMQEGRTLMLTYRGLPGDDQIPELMNAASKLREMNMVLYYACRTTLERNRR